MLIPEIYRWAKIKGINLCGTGDFTHPFWFSQLKKELKEKEGGLFTYKEGDSQVYFLLTAEVSSIYSQGGKGRRIHNILVSPSLAVVEKINKKLATYGSLSSDGRPILRISAQNLAGLVLEIDPQVLIIPAHIWTPWFSLYGSNSGFDSIEECFGELAKEIFAIETGLSSDPQMNWRIGELDKRAILSFSDAHSPQKLGREATIFEIDPNYDSFYEAIKEGKGVLATVEFFPEEGKYHFTGHRSCGVKHSPEDSKKLGTTCPVCQKPLTVGVMHRVEELATRDEEEIGILIKDVSLDGEVKVRAVSSSRLSRPIYFNLVPLAEIIAEAQGVGVDTAQVKAEYDRLTNHFGSEFSVLFKASDDELKKITTEKVTQGIGKVRKGDILVDPGFDGVYGKVQIWPEEEKIVEDKEQMHLFS